MYKPVPDGVSKSAPSVRYALAEPPAALSVCVHVLWQLKTTTPLTQDFILHAMPDACVNLMFNQRQTEIAGITALRSEHVELNLGREFHYVGVELLPGVWRGSPHEIADNYVGTAYTGSLPLIACGATMQPLDFAGKQAVMLDLVKQLMARGLIVKNPTTQTLLARLDEIRSVGDMAALAGVSARQLQRTLKASTGFSPHDLLKVLRLQQSFKRHYLDLYADQSHYIHAFRKATGYTPTQFASRFDAKRPSAG